MVTSSHFGCFYCVFVVCVCYFSSIGFNSCSGYSYVTWYRSQIVFVHISTLVTLVFILDGHTRICKCYFSWMRMILSSFSCLSSCASAFFLKIEYLGNFPGAKVLDFP